MKTKELTKDPDKQYEELSLYNRGVQPFSYGRSHFPDFYKARPLYQNLE